MKRIIITLILMISLVNLANAATNECYTFNTDQFGYLNESLRSQDMSGEVLEFTTGLLNSSVHQTMADNNNITVNLTNFGTIGTIDFWANMDSVDLNGRIGPSFGSPDGTGWNTDDRFSLVYSGGPASAAVWIIFKIGGVTECANVPMGFEVAAGGWNHFVLVFNQDSKLLVYHNGTNKYNCSTTATIPNTWNMTFGTAKVIKTNSKLDNLFVTTDKYSNADVTTKYNGGSGMTCYMLTLPYSYVKTTSSWDNSNIQGANVTLSNGISNLTQSDGIAYFYNISGNLSFNITYNGYYNQSGITNENNTVIYNMTVIDTTTPTITTNMPLNTTLDSLNISINISDKYIVETNITIESILTHLNNTKQSYFNYTNNSINISSLGIGTYQVNISTIDTGNNTAQLTTNITILPSSTYLNLRLLNYLGITTLTSVAIKENHTGNIQYSNPYTLATSNYLNKTSTSLNITVYGNDTSYLHIPLITSLILTRQGLEHNLTMTATQLYLAFYQDNQSINTTGYIKDEEPSRKDFSNSTLLVVQQELYEGLVHVRFGKNETGNYTQFYEYDNTKEENIAEDIEIIENPSNAVHLKVIDLGRVELKNAKIRMFVMTNTTVGVKAVGELAGQRLTESDGTTFFYFDEDDSMFFQISRDGYETLNLMYDAQLTTLNYPANSPLEIKLAKSRTSGDGTYLNLAMGESTCNGTGKIVAVGAERVVIQTDYRVTQGLGSRDITSSCNSLGECTFTLTEGIDCPINGGNFTITPTIDNTAKSPFEINYIELITYTEVLDIKGESESLGLDEDSGLYNTLGFIALILIILFSQLMFKNMVNDGMIPYTIGLAALVLIDPAFTMPLFIVAIGWVVKWYDTLLSD